MDRLKLIKLSAVFLLLVICPSNVRAITLEESIKRGLSVSYSVKEQEELTKKAKFTYLSTIDPYLPRFDLESSYSRVFSPVKSLDTVNFDFQRDTYRFGGVISYRIFDGGERYARRRGAYFTYEKSIEESKRVRQDVAFNIKKHFYEALGKKEILQLKKESLNIAQRIFDLTKARYEVGVARKSDVLQAKFRMESLAIEYENAQMEYRKALLALKSILLAKEEEILEVEGTLEKPAIKFQKEELLKRALSSRPELLAQEKELKKLEMVHKERKAVWYPKIDADVQHSRHDSTFFPQRRSDQFFLSLNLPIFDGVGRYYTLKSVEKEIASAYANLLEKRRLAELETLETLYDYEMSVKNVELHEKLVQEAAASFEQSLGEYRVGKSDILSVLNSEKDLTHAKEKYIISLVQANIALSLLEKVAYLKEY
ncbi:MAG: TolC family protein [Desulfobacterota bacterium]|nr:TolC family protein [Thermodesulfobacteriota bacterium]MDW8001723.1 TolC family protein [Deltaproteobacteria bacterium]